MKKVDLTNYSVKAVVQLLKGHKAIHEIVEQENYKDDNLRNYLNSNYIMTREQVERVVEFYK